jgi:hypothetical protein
LAVVIRSEGGIAGLNLLHDRLESHFRSLRHNRDTIGEGTPIFALEHGLSELEVELLKAGICEVVRQGHLPRQSWLPFIVYAAEIGYEYSGDEYWQTFATRTPCWLESGDRQFIRQSFEKFSRQFGGARPVGVWAEHFSIISWPITNAVLPKDLQRQLVQLLFDFRTALTSELLSNPAELGSRLAARTWHFSSRFQIFAQNTSLLGQVAAALLGEEDADSPFLLESTLNRIVDALSAEHIAKTWLRDTKSIASRVRTQGFRPVAERASGNRSGDPLRIPSPAEPDLLLLQVAQGWSLFVNLPDLSTLAERIPTIHEHLSRLRVRVAGSLSAPLAHGRLLFPGQRIRLDEWPDPQAPFLQIEGEGVDVLNRLLSDQCIMSPGPNWLFRVRERGFATEVKGRFVRPGCGYVLLDHSEHNEDEIPSWMSRCALTTSGISASRLSVPDVVTRSDIDFLKSLNLSVVSDIGVRPVGVVPGEWDGQGAAEWLAGEDVLLSISSNREISKCIITVDGAVTLLDWPDDNSELLLGITGLDVDVHKVHVGLIPEDVDDYVAEGSLLVSIRAAHSRPATGTIREGLVIFPTPLIPTLSEVWDGKANIQILGPSGAQILIQVDLVNRKESTLASHTFRARLPLGMNTWQQLVSREIRGSRQLQDVYDQSESLNVTITCVGVGRCKLRAEREFTALRWVVGYENRRGPYARLINNSDSDSIEIARFTFEHPTEAIDIGDSGDAVRWPEGGLLRARVSGFESSVILPPRVQDLDDLRRTDLVPQVPNTARTAAHILELIDRSHTWLEASLPADPFGERSRLSVLRALTSSLISSITGTRWSRMESQGLRRDQYSLGELERLTGEEPYQVELAARIRDHLLQWIPLEPESRVQPFIDAVSRSRRSVPPEEERYGEFLLRLASQPGSLFTWPPSELDSFINRSISKPVLVRASRLLVLAIHIDEEDVTGSTFRGWSWK